VRLAWRHPFPSPLYIIKYQKMSGTQGGGSLFLATSYREEGQAARAWVRRRRGREGGGNLKECFSISSRSWWGGEGGKGEGALLISPE